MAIIKSDSLRELERFFDEDFFGFVPAVKRNIPPLTDIYQTDNDLIVEMQVPKVDPNKVSISIEEGVLKVEGGEELENETEGKDYYRREIRRGSFTRMIGLPVAVKEEETKASYEHGILKITMPKAEKKSKKIEVEIK